VTVPILDGKIKITPEGWTTCYRRKPINVLTVTGSYSDYLRVIYHWMLPEFISD
jgi:hypothetical protein